MLSSCVLVRVTIRGYEHVNFIEEKISFVSMEVQRRESEA
jgi:hypothetical protein